VDTHATGCPASAPICSCSHARSGTSTPGSWTLAAQPRPFHFQLAVIQKTDRLAAIENHVPERRLPCCGGLRQPPWPTAAARPECARPVTSISSLQATALLDQIHHGQKTLPILDQNPISSCSLTFPCVRMCDKLSSRRFSSRCGNRFFQNQLNRRSTSTMVGHPPKHRCHPERRGRASRAHAVESLPENTAAMVAPVSRPRSAVSYRTSSPGEIFILSGDARRHV